MGERNVFRGEQTRGEIIRAAHKLFVQQGYHGTSMRQIAKQAGIALGGLYNHFDSKQEVFQAEFSSGRVTGRSCAGSVRCCSGANGKAGAVCAA